MSQEVLPSPTETTRNLTFNVPNILLKREEHNGFSLLHVRLGGPTQIEFKTSVTYCEQPVDESSQIFVVKATNKINFGDGSIRVLNDAMHDSHPLAATYPTASEYINKVGKPVLLSFRCNPDQQESTRLERSIFRVVRVSILLP